MGFNMDNTTDMIKKRRILDKTGKTFGKLLVKFLGPDNVQETYKKIRWWCECMVCGKTHLIESGVLKQRYWKHGCKECSYKHRTLTIRHKKGESGKRLMYLQYRNNAKKMDRSFTLTMEQFTTITQNSCKYCGAKPEQICKPPLNNGRTQDGIEWAAYKHNGIDRIDNDRGYEYDNCVACCGKCNLMKRSMSVDEFLKHTEKIHNHKKEVE